MYTYKEFEWSFPMMGDKVFLETTGNQKNPLSTK